MANEFATLEIAQEGETTRVTFVDADGLDRINISACKEQITEIVKRNNTRTLAFDMRGVRLIPSGMLGLLASLKSVVMTIEILNPSEDVREVLEVTKLNQLFVVRNEA